jgi:hypothetical protein
MTRLDRKNLQKERAGAIEQRNDDGSLKLYYDSEFRKWHIKLVLIILCIITCLFMALLEASRLF